MLHLRRWPLLVTLVLVAGAASMAMAVGTHTQPTKPLDAAAIASPAVGLERAVLTAKPGAQLERLRAQVNPRHWGSVLAALLVLIALAGRPSTLFQRSRVGASPNRADCGREQPSRAPPRPLLIRT